MVSKPLASKGVCLGSCLKGRVQLASDFAVSRAGLKLIKGGVRAAKC